MSYDSKPTNPKDIIGSNKVPLSLVPSTTIAYLAVAHLEGHLKYGLVNWREKGVKASVYLDAAQRHLAKWMNGEWADEATHVPHLANALACISIIVDAIECGKLIDDRPKEAPITRTLDELSGTVKHLRELFKDCAPIHYMHQNTGDETL